MEHNKDLCYSFVETFPEFCSIYKSELYDLLEKKGYRPGTAAFLPDAYAIRDSRNGSVIYPDPLCVGCADKVTLSEDDDAAFLGYYNTDELDSVSYDYLLRCFECDQLLFQPLNRQHTRNLLRSFARQIDVEKDLSTEDWALTWLSACSLPSGDPLWDLVGYIVVSKNTSDR